MPSFNPLYLSKIKMNTKKEEHSRKRLIDRSHNKNMLTQASKKQIIYYLICTLFLSLFLTFLAEHSA